MSQDDRPIVLITGAAGNIGRSLAAALADAYSVVGFDQEGRKADFPLIGVDFTDDTTVKQAMERFRTDTGSRIASVKIGRESDREEGRQYVSIRGVAVKYKK